MKRQFWPDFDYRKPTYEMLKRAYPNGVPDDEYLALVAIMNKSMSFRNTAHYVATVSERDWGLVYNDVLGIGSADRRPALEDVARVQAKLDKAGYADWHAEQEAFEESLKRPPVNE
jgi:hypothetical protein